MAVLAAITSMAVTTGSSYTNMNGAYVIGNPNPNAPKK